jgi:ABC-type spermidine/putrescine transport system permease subunit II
MVAIGFAFAKVAEATEGYSLKDIALASLAMVFMSIAVALSSYALAMIKPISFTQALTAVFISGVFSIVAFGMRKLLQAFKGVSFSSLVKSVIFLPLILPAIALGIALASYAFGLVQPIGFSQVISSIFIAAIFSVVAFGIRNMLQAFKGMNPKTLIQASIFLPLILPAIALGIAGASYALALVQPVGLMQWFTSVLIGILFVVLSFGMGIKWNGVVLLNYQYSLL